MSDLLTRAKEIKNATEIGENTAERVGGVMVDTIKVIPSKIRIAEYDVSMTKEDENRLYAGAEITLENSEGKELANERINGASEQYPGLMSIRKFRQVNAHEIAITALQQTIKDLTIRIEELEKGGGGGGSSTDVEDGTLSASASVVNEVMSVQGSVKDGILKL